RASGAVAAPTAEQVQTGGRVLDLLRGVAGEYAEAFDDQGHLVRPIELEEAGLLLAEARDLVPRLGIDAADVRRIEQAIADLAARVTAATGVALQPLPALAPSVERGAALFQENCASCHGADGRGDGAESRRLGLSPANFTDLAFMQVETPDDFFNVVTLGRRRSGMPAWSDALSVQQRWDVVRYLWSLTHTSAVVEQGRALLASSCSTCGDGPATPAELASKSDADLRGALESGPAAGADRGRRGAPCPRLRRTRSAERQHDAGASRALGTRCARRGTRPARRRRRGARTRQCRGAGPRHGRLHALRALREAARGHRAGARASR